VKSSAYILLTILTMVVVSGCSSISMVHSWKDPAAPAKQYRKVLVVGISEKIQSRQIFEEVFASEIGKSGAVGIPSYTITGVQGKPSREALEAAVKKTGADSVFVTRLVNMRKEWQGRTGFVIEDRGTDAFWGATVTYAVFVHQPVEVLMSSNVALETDLFDAGTGLMVWSGTSSVEDPSSLITISREVANIVVRSMNKDGFM